MKLFGGWVEVQTLPSLSVLQGTVGKSLASHIVPSSLPGRYENFVGDGGLSTSKIVRFLLKDEDFALPVSLLCVCYNM